MEYVNTTSNVQHGYIPYESLEKRLKSIPEEFFIDVSNFFDLLEYKIEVIQSETESTGNLSAQDGLNLLKKITGCVLESTSLEDEKTEYFAEKYRMNK